METQYILYIVITVVCLFVSAFFSASETAFFSLTKADLHRFSISPAGSLERRIYNLMGEPQKILITILAGNMFANIVITSLSTFLLLIWSKYGHFISAAIVTPAIILFCEISPKIIAYNESEGMAKRTFRLLNFFHVLLGPIRAFLLFFTNSLIRIFKLKTSHSAFTSAELGQAVQDGEAEGIINRDESVFIQNVLLFSRKEAANVMYPRNMAVFLPEGSTIKEAMSLFLQHNVVRIPVFRNDYDHIIGYLDSKDIISCYMGYKKVQKIDNYIHPIDFYPSTRELHDLLNDLIAKRSQIAILVDEYGGVDGVVTLNRILIELMGKGFSRWDEIHHPEKRKISASEIISGDMQITDYNFKFDDSIESDDSDTVGGYIIETIGHLPKRGESINTSLYTLRVRRIAHNRVESIEVVRNAR